MRRLGLHRRTDAFEDARPDMMSERPVISVARERHENVHRLCIAMM